MNLFFAIKGLSLSNTHTDETRMIPLKAPKDVRYEVTGWLMVKVIPGYPCRLAISMVYSLL